LPIPKHLAGDLTRTAELLQREAEQVAPAGQEVWRFAAGEKLYAAPTIYQDNLYLGTEDGVLHAVDTRQGNQLWHFSLPEHWLPTEAVAAEGLVFVGARDARLLGSGDKVLLALDAASGEEVWRFETGALNLSAPVVGAGRVYFGANDGTVYALEAKGGQELWRSRIEGWTPFHPTVAEGTLYLGSQGYTLHALHAESGRVKWRFTAGGQVPYSPAAAEGVVYFGSWDGNLYAVDPQKGDELWRFTAGRALTTSPSVAEGIVYFGCYDRQVYAVEAESGQELWRFETGGRIYSAPVVAGGKVYFGCDDKNLYAVDAASGAEAWRFEAEGKIKYAPLIARGMIYLGSRHGTLYALSCYGEERLLSPQEYESRGDILQAARAYALAGELSRAAELFQREGEHTKAAELYRESGDLSQAAEMYAELGQHTRAAELYEKAEEQLLRAAELYLQAEDPTKAKELYDQAGELVRAAELCVDLGLFYEAAQTYERAALIMEKEGEETDIDERQLGELFHLAAQNYRLEFDDVRADECRRKSIRYKRLPDMQVSISAEEGFRVLEWKAFRLTLSNTGYGVARDIEFTVSGAFEGDATRGVAGLRGGDSREFDISIKPTEAGKRVPLTIRASYRDPVGELWEVEREAFIEVAQHEAPKSGRFSSLATMQKRIESLRRQHQRLLQNLEILEQRKARYGIDVPLYILNEIDDHKEEIERIKAELSSLELPSTAARSDSSKRPKLMKFIFTPPEPDDYRNWFSAFRRITEEGRANGSWTDKNDVGNKFKHLEDFVKPLCKGQVYDASLALYSKDADGNFYEEVVVIVKFKPERELSFEVTDRTQAQKREELANRIQQGIGKLKGVRLISLEPYEEPSSTAQ
jgi:outer membrane protein assembly factor BamB